MQNLIKTLVATLLIPLLSSCANYGLDKHFESNSQVLAQAGTEALPSGRATIYYFRERAWLQPLLTQPIPPAYFGINERLVSVMPVGSYVRLSLEPGIHNFSRVIVSPNWPFSNIVRKHELQVTLRANETHYVGSMNTFGDTPIQLVDGASGRRMVAELQLAKLVHRPESVESFMARVQGPPASNSTTSLSAQLSGALPSGEQVVSFLESLATVALAAVILVAIVTSASAGSLPPQPAIIYPSVQRPAIASPVVTTPLYIDSPSRWRRSDGSLAEIIQSKDKLVMTDLNGGPSYTVKSGNIVGSDGSRYRVYNSTIISDTGQFYQVIGNTLYASDGRKCTKTGNVISCR